MTHAELVARGHSWLRRQGCAIVLSEFSANTQEHPDCIGWKSHTSIVIECKASRSDFLADKSKAFRQPGCGMGDFRLYLAPPGILAVSDLPEGWGLLIANGSRIEIAGPVPRAYTVESWGKKRKCTAWYPEPFAGDKRAESILLLSALRRLQLHHGQAECDRLIHMTYADKQAETA